ncbi:cytochrome P450 [Lasiosphaeria ovina]|uniref:Cytochrome P450 n=1 Tax=Lasiosphaeria ovina TaxID=92902 RepID=A0AAE0MYG2_9PEZI|nr:cytochrome P450 [Lasiosphaeria ovina]
MADNVHEKWLQWNREYGHVFQTRKRLAPAFRPEAVSLQYPYFAKHLTNLIKLLDAAAGGNNPVDMSSLHVRLTLDFMGDIAYGVELDALSEGGECRIVKLLDTILPELMKCGFFPLRSKIPILARTREMHRAIAEIRMMAENAIQNARQNRGDSSESEEKPSNRIFDILTRQKEPDGNFTFSSKELVDNYVAGADTTAHTMSFLIYEVLRNPDILATLHSELDARIPFGVKIPSLEQVKLPYSGMLLKETLRYNSTGFGTFRICPQDTEISSTVPPANTTLALWNPAVHRDPRLWKDLDTFDPERWRSNERKMRGSYFPFYYGPRNCLG